MKKNVLSLAIGVLIGIPLALAVTGGQEQKTRLPVAHEYMVFEGEEPAVQETFPNRRDTYVEPIAESDVPNTPVEVGGDAHTPLSPTPLDEDVRLLAAVCQSEAGNQGNQGMRLVASVVLNRVDSEEFPDSISEVVYQKNQFSVVNNGALESALNNLREDAIEAARSELETRTDSEILFFCCTGYNRYGTPVYQYKDHYFSK